jgi:hypothetical protein
MNLVGNVVLAAYISDCVSSLMCANPVLRASFIRAKADMYGGIIRVTASQLDEYALCLFSTTHDVRGKQHN